MNLDNLACFVEVAQTGSITETARRRFTSQQAVSDQIRRLEAYYQTPLLERTRPLGLTAAGKLVYETAREVMGTMERLKERVERLRREEDRLVICTGMAATPPFLPDLMMRFQQEMPEVEMTLIHPQNTSAVLTAPPPEADLLIGNLPFDHDVEAIELLRDPFSVVASDALLTRIFGPAWEEAELGEADWCRVPFQITRKTEREALSWAPLRDQVIHADSLDLRCLQAANRCTFFPSGRGRPPTVWEWGSGGRKRGAGRRRDFSGWPGHTSQNRERRRKKRNKEMFGRGAWQDHVPRSLFCLTEQKR